MSHSLGSPAALPAAAPPAAAPPPDPLLVFDGGCPFCRHFAELSELRAGIPGLRIVDGRADHELRAQLTRRGLRLADGAVLIDGERLLHGAEAIQALCARMEPSAALLRLLGPLLAELVPGAVDARDIPNTLAGTLPGAYLVLRWRGVQLQLPRTNNAGAPSFSDGKWAWSEEDPSHPLLRLRLAGGDVQEFVCAAEA